ncbi:RNA polymerase ECF family sigma subunit [Amycolatopsis echigonensis]|uniref:RNA polymerase ECF family sigma subunit n=1 Tax=Amycolatopsis echigonensis TaxID=2576905 RepID=A0A2N3WSU1_9PSEU|nr:RNA polymerase sigma factor ShbA [Amycolatopsis niigatensis]PKV96920.1 RNA polymerase ECF family sigma subunit [Amycolatopsis niigatensis]
MTPCTEHGIDLKSVAKAAGEGDRDAIAAVLTAIQPRVIRYCRARIGSRPGYASADDVAQDVLTGVFTALPSYRDTGRSFLAFVFGIAAHKVVDFHRKQQRDLSTAVTDVPERADADSGPEQALLDAELRHMVRELLGTLPDTQQEILVHRVIGEMSSEKTAELLSSTPGAVRVAQHRALDKLRRRLTGQQ